MCAESSNVAELLKYFETQIKARKESTHAKEYLNDLHEMFQHMKPYLALPESAIMYIEMEIEKALKGA